jgi:hypothetical protein
LTSQTILKSSTEESSKSKSWNQKCKHDQYWLLLVKKP